jgi:hypothetical protein
MRHLALRGVIGLAAFCVGVATDAPAAEKKPDKAIKVLEATYGGNCAGIAKGNVTEFVGSKCNDTNLCNYRVYYKSMGGDPATDCKKDFSVTYSCGRKSKRETCTVAAEAGMGGEEGHPNQFCLLHCVRTMDQPGNGLSARRQVSGTSPAPSERPAVTAPQARGPADSRFNTANPW